MKRPLLILLASFFIITSIHSQLRIAFVGGGHVASVNETNQLPGWDSVKNNFSSRTGFHAGVIADVPFGPKSMFYFQPGVIFYMKGRKYEAPLDSVGLVRTYNASQYINYIDIPLNVVVKIPITKKLKFTIGAGPYASFFYNGKEQSETFYNDGTFESNENEDLGVGKKENQYKIFDYGVNALAGIEFGRVFLTANYSRGLGDFYTASYEGSFKHQVIGGTLGIYLGKPVEIAPKIKDKDKDGIPDEKDECPTLAGTAATNGCPDKDADGIADKDDKCVDIPGTKKYNGCPVPDTDKDGVNDDQDKCPTVAGLSKYNGCPIPDTDNDGVNDEQDKCPATAGLAKYNGCPIPDSDNDGVNDEEDKCPTTAGTKENNGCPEIKKEIVEKVNFAARSIQFELGKATITTSSYDELNQIAEILKQNPELKIDIEGHTSDDGTVQRNMQLSQKRADHVKEYLVSKGVDAGRLNAKGYGASKPINNGKTAAARAVNRRVELKLSNQ